MRQLGEAGLDVVVGARDEAAGRAAASQIPGARFLDLDVTSDESVRAAAAALGALDVSSTTRALEIRTTGAPRPFR